MTLLDHMLNILQPAPHTSRAREDVARATGQSVRRVARMSPQEVVDTIVAAGIPLSDVPDHVWRDLGMIPLNR